MYDKVDNFTKNKQMETQIYNTQNQIINWESCESEILPSIKIY